MRVRLGVPWSPQRVHGGSSGGGRLMRLDSESEGAAP
jgi:hypothetical protein